MRPFLALDTATEHVAIGVGDLDSPGAVVAAEDFTAPRAANTVLLLAIERILAAAGIGPGDLGAVACGRGPGSFTGVRIGVATAKGVALGARVPLVGFGTADAVAHSAEETEGFIGVVSDAMRGEVYPALFRASGAARRRLGPDTVASPAEAAALWTALEGPLALTGNGLAKHAEVFASAVPGARVVDRRLWAPRGAALVAAAWAESGPASLGAIAELSSDDAWASAHPGLLLPIYTRLSDAEEAERAGARATGRLPAGGVAGPGGGSSE